MISLSERINNFLSYLENVRAYAPNSIVTYENVLQEMSSVSHYYEEDKRVVLDITPLRLKIVNNSKKTIAKKLSAIHSFIKFMEDQEEVNVEFIGNSVIKVPKTLPKPIDENIIEEVLKSCNFKERLVITLLYGLGLRISELAALELSNISNKWIRIIGKGNKERQVPLLELIYKEISYYIKCENPKKFLFEKDDKEMNSHQIRYMFSKIFKRSGIKATPHQLRHSFATHLLHNGARISDVSELMGHSSMVSTQIYTQLKNSKKLDEYSKAHPLCANSNNIGE
jgi:integrase/recombinase XerC